MLITVNARIRVSLPISQKHLLVRITKYSRAPRRPKKVPVLNGPRYFSPKIYLLFAQNTKEIIRDIIIVKINVSNLQKAVILRTISIDTLRIRTFRHYSIKTIVMVSSKGFLTLEKVRFVGETRLTMKSP